jgi:hypothetical protein
MAGADDAIRASLAGRMFERRAIFLHGALDDRAAGELAIALMALDAEGDGPIALTIDCADGTLDGALASIDTIDLLGVPVHATCVGRVEGPACGVLTPRSSSNGSDRDSAATWRGSPTRRAARRGASRTTSPAGASSTRRERSDTA